MSGIYTSVDQLIGGTPLLELVRIQQQEGLRARILAKLEHLNPGGSAKDRVGRALIDDAEARGLLRPGSVIIEPTSGNTGIGLACVAAARGYRTVIVMPDSMSVERRKLMGAYGAEVVLTPGAQGMQGAIQRAEELAREIPGSFIPGQFDNPANPAAHRASTGPEIWRDTGGQVDIFVASVGTGGTITGTGQYLREQKADVEIVGLMVSLNRMERGLDSEKSALFEIRQKYGFDANAIVTMEEVVDCLYDKPYKGTIYIDDTLKRAIDAYYEQYGAK